ncbi:MAG: alpha-amylase, partial [Thiothrix sp.]|nr:alpha-amylase [Thiothrix sp.]
NATFMALLWDAVSTRNVRLLNQGLRSQPAKPARTTWLNYVRCHDDIGLGFEDADIIAAGYDVAAHRKFLIRYLSGKFPGSTARGLPFGANEKTGDARISGSLASLAGLESALESAETLRIEQALQRILTLHALILSWGGIALLYYGDELALLNDYGYADDPDKAPDNRWVHRPQIDWKAAEARAGTEAVSGRIFNGLRHLIRVRRQIPVFADWNNRILLLNDNQHLFTFYCFDPQGREAPVTVVANFDEQEHFLNLDNLRRQGISLGQLTDLAGGTVLETPEPHLLKVPACGFYWLASD